MAEDDGGEGGEGKLPCVDHGPLNEGAVGKTMTQTDFSLKFGGFSKFYPLSRVLASDFQFLQTLIHNFLEED